MSIPAKSRKTDLLKLPDAKWGVEAWYDFLLIVPTRKMHDSGYAHIAIIGGKYDSENGDQAVEIIASPDDLQWPTETAISSRMPEYGALRTDAYWPSGVIRLWSGEYLFGVDHPTSSTAIKIRRYAK